MRRGALLAIVWWATGLGDAAPAEAQVELRAEVRLRGSILTDTTVGGIGETLAEWSDASLVEDPVFGYRRASGAELTSNTAGGFMRGASYSETFISDSISRPSAFVEMRMKQDDTFTIGPGTSGLANGDPVQVRVQAYTKSTLVLVGRPNALSGFYFNVEGVPGVVGRWIDWTSGFLHPPQEIEFEEYWEIVADTTVGSSFTLRSNLEAIMGDTTFDGPMEEAQRSDATSLGWVRVSAGDGFEDIEITSLAGAPTTPVEAVPALSPAGLAVLAAALAIAARSLRFSARSTSARAGGGRCRAGPRRARAA